MSLYTKLFALQNEVGAITKDSQNPFFKSAYFDINKLIETLKPLLQKNGIVVLQPLEWIDGRNVLKTIIVDSETGEKIESSVSLPSDIEPQKTGSAVTYLRRYSLQSTLFLQAEDDDGSAASPKNTGAKPYPKTAQEVTKDIKFNGEPPF